MNYISKIYLSKIYLYIWYNQNSENHKRKLCTCLWNLICIWKKRMKCIHYFTFLNNTPYLIKRQIHLMITVILLTLDRLFKFVIWFWIIVKRSLEMLHANFPQLFFFFFMYKITLEKTLRTVIFGLWTSWQSNWWNKCQLHVSYSAKWIISVWSLLCQGKNGKLIGLSFT